MMGIMVDPENFNPRSRVGNDQLHTDTRQAATISIHVPAWGTTIETVPITSGSGDFNPRSRVGNDRIMLDRHPDMEFQSTFPRGERL